MDNLTAAQSIGLRRFSALRCYGQSYKISGKVYSRDYVIDYTSPENDDLYVYAMGNGSLEYEQKHVYVDSERIEQYTERGTDSWERLLYVHEDVMGNTYYYTKTTGGTFADLEYDAWGMPQSPNKLINNDHGNYVFATFTGHIYDTTLDIYFAEVRFYDATNRTWMAMDPIKSGYNWYQYCYSNPRTYFDYNGLFPIPLITGAIGAIGGALISGVSNIIAQSQSGNDIDWGQVGQASLKGLAIGGMAGLTMGAAAVTLPAAGVAVGLQASMTMSSIGITLSTGTIAGIQTVATIAGGASIAATGVFAASNAIEVGSGYNPIRDSLLNGNQEVYSSLQVANSMVNLGIVQLGSTSYALGSLNPTKDVLTKVKSYFTSPTCNGMTQQSTFPEDPYDFNPEGLTRVGPYSTKNGDIIKWLDSDKNAVYEWDEDLKYGAHYHVIGDDGNTRIPGPDGETHFQPGDPIP